MLTQSYLHSNWAGLLAIGLMLGLAQPTAAQAIKMLGVETDQLAAYRSVGRLGPGIAFEKVSAFDFATVDLDLYDVLFLTGVANSGPGGPSAQLVLDALNARAADLEKWLGAGGGIVAQSEVPFAGNPLTGMWEWMPDAIQPKVGAPVHRDPVTILLPDHPVMTNLTDRGLSNWMRSWHGEFLSTGGLDVLADGGAVGPRLPVILAGEFGFGRIVITALDAEGHIFENPMPGKQYVEFLQNALEWVMPLRNPPSYTPFGTGCPSSVGLTPTLAAITQPRLGENFVVRVENLALGTPVFMVTGFSKIVERSLDDFGLWGCTAYISVDVALPLPLFLGAPFTEWRLKLPSIYPSLLGTIFYNQAFVLDLGGPGVNPAKAIVSNAAEGRIGRYGSPRHRGVHNGQRAITRHSFCRSRRVP